MSTYSPGVSSSRQRRKDAGIRPSEILQLGGEEDKDRGEQLEEHCLLSLALSLVQGQRNERARG